MLEDKVVKNYVATEFLYDYLKDKPTVGVIDTDPERGIEYVAEPIGVVMAITPITNPTSTVLFKAIVAAKTRNAIVFRPSPRAVRCAERVAEVLREAGEKAGLPSGALQVIPDLPHEVTHYLFHHPGIDFIWTTGGPKVVRAANSAGKPAISVGPGNAPVYLHRTADVKMAVVDILISKTFDASVICPAEQTCVIDDAIYDDVVAEFERMGARLLDADEVGRLAGFTFGCDGVVNLEALGQPAAVLARAADIDADEDDQGPARAAARGPRRARRAPARGREAHARPRVGPRPRRAARARRLRARHRARRPRPHLRRLRHATSRSSTASRGRSAPAASSSTRRRPWARSAASTTP